MVMKLNYPPERIHHPSQILLSLLVCSEANKARASRIQIRITISASTASDQDHHKRLGANLRQIFNQIYYFHFTF